MEGAYRVKKETPEILDRVADKVLSYRPKPKSKARKRRERRKKREAQKDGGR